MSIISALQIYLKTYSSIPAAVPVMVDYLSIIPAGYAIIPLAGNKIVESYVDGSSLREFPFAFQSMQSTADDLARLENNGFFEAFSDWLDSQTAAGTLPTLATGRTPVEISAIGWGYLYQQGESDTGVYQVQCKLIYEQVKP
jgi:hypothetical protein